MNAMYQVLYREDGLYDEEREPGAPYPVAILERWAANSTVRYIVTVGWQELSQWGSEWANEPITTMLDVTSDAAAIRYAIKAYDAFRAERYVAHKK